MVELNGIWELSWVDDFPEFLIHPDAPMRHRLTAQVPEPVHQTLRRHGLLDDPNIGLNSLRARWVEEQFWVYRHRFPTPEAAADSPAWLCFEHLEQDAIVYVNGLEVGRHSNAHRPARFEVTGKLNTNSENTVVVRVDAGLYAVADKPGAEYQPQLSVLLNKRHWQRKGQWQAGWDWQQRLMNVGILGDVRLEWAEAPLLTDVVVRAQPSPDLQSGRFRAEAETFNPADEPIAAVLRLRVDNTDVDVAQDIELAPGWSNPSITANLDNPELWWPVGHGNPHRYHVEVMLEIGSSTQTRSRHTGVRSVEIDHSPHPATGRHCSR
ncbi:MAG: glycosyl hydrolase 2 galactose-binding domain-containing protein, partial [Armatimonadaceae bacterium]